MKVHVTLVYEYNIPDAAADRYELYGVEEPSECVRIDLENELVDLYDYAEVIHTEFSILGVKL